MKLLIGLAAVAFGLGAAHAAEQGSPSQQQSVAEAARRNQARKSQAAQAKPERTFDTDSLLAPLPLAPGQAAVPDLATGAASPASAPAGAPGDDPASAEGEKQRDKAGQALAEAKARVAALQAELQLMERDHSLARQQFYQNPAPQTDKAGQAALGAQEAAITAKKLEITEAEARVAALEAEVAAVNDRLGPRPDRPASPEETASQFASRLAALRSQLAEIDAEIARINAQTTAAGAKPADIPAGSFTSQQLADLQTRRAAVQQQISEAEDEARRARVPAGATRPPQ